MKKKCPDCHIDYAVRHIHNKTCAVRDNVTLTLTRDQTQEVLVGLDVYRLSLVKLEGWKAAAHLIGISAAIREDLKRNNNL